MNVGDLVVLIPDNCPESKLHYIPNFGGVGMIIEYDDGYEAKGITGNLVNHVKVQFSSGFWWLDTDQVEVLDESR